MFEGNPTDVVIAVVLITLGVVGLVLWLASLAYRKAPEQPGDLSDLDRRDGLG